MHISVVFAAMVGVAAAQSTSICAAQPVLDTCLATTKSNALDCGPTDYDCLCTAYTAIATCYNQCPNDSGLFAAQQQQTSYCNSAKANPTTSLSSVVSTALTSASATGTSTGMSGSASSGSTKTSTTSATGTKASAAATKSGAAIGLTIPAGGALALAGMVGMVL